MARKRGRDFLHPPRDGLLAVGVDPGKVADVICFLGHQPRVPRCRHLSPDHPLHKLTEPIGVNGVQFDAFGAYSATIWTRSWSAIAG